MNLLAFELSSALGSVSLFIDKKLAYESSWDCSGKRNQDLLKHVMALLDYFQVSMDDIDAFAVGRGPGNYSGMRVALTTALALALPGRKRVVAVSSGMALAREVAERSRESVVTILGDARRRALWAGTFWAREGEGIRQDGEYVLIPYQHAPRYGFAKGPIVSSERSRVLPHLGDLSKLVISNNWYPSSRQVGLLALEIIHGKGQSEPLTPIYMHPPVEERQKA